MQTHFLKLFRRMSLKLIGTGALVFVAAMPAAEAQAPAKGWEQEWATTVAAAKKEGQLNVSGPSGRAWRDVLMTFQEAYPDIKLKITPASSAEFWPRVVIEREAKQYLWDLRIGGPDSLGFDMKKKGIIVSVREQMLLPEVVDGSKWHGGIDKMFLDNDKRYFLSFAMYAQSIGHFDTKTIATGFKVENLIDPKYFGKISMADPRGGSTNNSLAILYRQYGREFLKKFLEQKPVIAAQSRQQMDWLRTGRYPIAIGVPTAAFVEAGQRGVNVDQFEKVSAGAWSQGVGGIQLIDKAPNPNAAKVFINWLLTKNVQDRVMKAVDLNSRRKDVQIHNKDEALSQEMINDAFGSQEEAGMPFRDKVKELLDEMKFQM